jgi:hypothetical protein
MRAFERLETAVRLVEFPEEPDLHSGESTIPATP